MAPTAREVALEVPDDVVVQLLYRDAFAPGPIEQMLGGPKVTASGYTGVARIVEFFGKAIDICTGAAVTKLFDELSGLIIVGKHVVLQGNSTNPQRYDDGLDYAQQIASPSLGIRLNHNAPYPCVLNLICIKLLFALNLEYEEWYELFQRKALVDALLDRLQHRCTTIRLDGPSLRATDPAASS